MKAIKQNASGSTFAKISSSVLKMIKVCLPPKIQHDKFSEIGDPILKMNGQISVG